MLSALYKFYHMLETPKALSTIYNTSENLKDVTMGNQQETNGGIIILVGSSETIRKRLIG
jgi:hypothetical protein